MARRVALARAIAIDPLLAMYDEPFAGLDPISINVIAKLIRVLNDELGTTSIIVSYDVQESLKVADHIFVIGDGKLKTLDGVYGIRAAHNTEVMVSGLSAGKP